MLGGGYLEDTGLPDRVQAVVMDLHSRAMESHEWTVTLGQAVWIASQQTSEQ